MCTRSAVVIKTPVPRLTNPPSCGKDGWETTRNGSVRWAPECVVTVTSTTEPMCAPTRCMVETPRPIWPSPTGGCPTTVEKRSVPLTAVPTMLPTIFPLTMTSPPPTPLVIAVTSGLSLRLLTRAVFAGSKLTCSGSPHSPDVAVRWLRLAPKTPVAHSAMTASTIPKRAEPSGTAVPPDRRSTALRTPMTAVGGAPRVTRWATSAEGRDCAVRSSTRRVRAWPATPATCRGPARPPPWRGHRAGARARRTRSRWRSRPGVPRRAVQSGTTRWRSRRRRRRRPAPPPGFVPCPVRRAVAGTSRRRPASDGPRSRQRSGGPAPAPRPPARRERRAPRGSTTRRPADGWRPRSWRRPRLRWRSPHWDWRRPGSVISPAGRIGSCPRLRVEGGRSTGTALPCGGAPHARTPGRRRGGRQGWSPRETRIRWLRSRPPGGRRRGP